MIISCEKCGATISPENLEVTKDGLKANCQQCGHKEGITTSAPDTQVSPAPPETEQKAETTKTENPDQVCRKCLTPYQESSACAKCGLEFALYKKGEMPWEIEENNLDPKLKEELGALWNKLRKSPKDENLHKSFQEFCALNDSLPYCAGCYRNFLIKNPDNVPFIVHREFLIEKMQARFLLVPQEGSEEFTENVNQFRKFLFGVVIVTWILLMIYFASSLDVIPG